MGELRERVLRQLRERRERVVRGDINVIPSPFKRFSNDFLGIEQGRYYLVTGSTKAAKTQLATFLFINTVLFYAYKHPDKIRVKIFYYPLEESKEDIFIRFMCHCLYVGSDLEINPNVLKSAVNNEPIDENILNLIEKDERYKRIEEFFEESIIFSTSSNPTGVYNECRNYAESHGKVHKKTISIKDDIGEIKDVKVFDWYEADDPNEYRIIFFDHASLIHTERKMELKGSIDKLSEYCVELRNKYNFSPVIIQQQAFAGESLEAFKENKLRPSIANLSDSKYCGRDANICLGIFNPAKHEISEYFKYDITKLKNNIRFLEVVVNRNGPSGGIVALYFNGAVNYFEELPLPENKLELERYYRMAKESEEKMRERK